MLDIYISRMTPESISDRLQAVPYQLVVRGPGQLAGGGGSQAQGHGLLVRQHVVWASTHHGERTSL